MSARRKGAERYQWISRQFGAGRRQRGESSAYLESKWLKGEQANADATRTTQEYEQCCYGMFSRSACSPPRRGVMRRKVNIGSTPTNHPGCVVCDHASKDDQDLPAPPYSGNRPCRAGVEENNGIQRSWPLTLAAGRRRQHGKYQYLCASLI